MNSRIIQYSTTINKFFIKLSHKRRFAFICFLVAMLSVLVACSDQTDKFDRLFYDSASRVLSKYFAPSQEVAIVALDTETLEATPERWPWSRARFARLIEAISSHHPRAIVLDIVFQHPEESDDGAGDRILRDTIAATGNVVLVGFVEEELTDTGRQKRQYRSLKLFRDVAFCDGYIHSHIDSDSKIRTFSVYDSKLAEEGCLLKLARLTEKTVKTRSVQANVPETSQIIFARKNGGIPLYSGQDIIEGKIAPAALKDKIIITGATAQVLHDYHETSLGLIAGPIILAAALDTILSNRLSEPQNGLPLRFFLVIMGLLASFCMVTRASMRQELASFLFFSVSLAALYHIAAFLLIFMPLSCFFISWAFASVFYYLINRFNEVVDQQVASAEAACAGEIQAQLFPAKSILTEAYSVRGMCLPCDATGGDFFDYFELEDGNIVFILGDVAGHGFSAAILTIMAKTTVQLLRQKNMATPENIVSTLNQIILELIKKKKFMTLAAGHLNCGSHVISMVLAGHLPPLHITADGKLLELNKAGFPLGVIKNLPLRTVTCQMQPGDSLILYTDGIVEALNWQNEQYTYQSWYDFLKKSMPEFTEEHGLEGLLEGVKQHKAGRNFDDDVTYIVIRRRLQDLGRNTAV